MATNNYELDFWIKGDSPNTRFEIRFVDSKTTVAGDHPWRNSYTIDQTKITWDGTWKHVKIPLKNFKETGSWDNGSWFNAAGKFDWKAVDRLEFISEFGALGTQKIWFDEILINGTPLTSAKENIGKNDFNATAFPNPLTENTTIQYNLPETGFVNVSIYDLTGRKLTTLTDARETQGRHQIQWTPNQKGFSKPTEGIYLCKITCSGRTVVLKLILQNK